LFKYIIIHCKDFEKLAILLLKIEQYTGFIE
jgi:hypothetical protein